MLYVAFYPGCYNKNSYVSLKTTTHETTSVHTNVTIICHLYAAYVNHLLSAVEELLACGSKGGTDATPQPPHLSAAFGPVDKVAIVEAHKSRFAGN